MDGRTESVPGGDDKKPRRRARLELMKEWQVSEDGRSVTRTFEVESFKEAAKFASRVVAFGCKHGVAVDLHADGQTVIVGMPNTTTPTHLLDRKQRGMAQRLERLVTRPGKSDEAGDKAE